MRKFVVMLISATWIVVSCQVAEMQRESKFGDATIDPRPAHTTVVKK